MASNNDIKIRFIVETDKPSFAEADRVLEKTADNATRVQKQMTNFVPGDAEFSQASKNVALAGDVESNLRTVGGALGTVGGEAGRAAEGLIAVGAEFPAVIEAAGRLPAAISGLPAAAKSAVSAIGPTGVGLGAVMVGLGVIASKLTNQMGKQADKMKSLIDAQNEYFEVLVNGTEEDAQAALKAAEESKAAAVVQRDALRAQYEQATGAVNDAGLAWLYDIQGAFGSNEIEEMEHALDELDKTIASSNTTIDKFSEGLNNNVFAAAEAEETTTEVAEAIEAELIPAQTKLIDTTKATAKAAEDASQKVAEARAKERQVVEESIKAGGKAAAERKALLVEQSKQLTEVQNDEFKRRIEDEKDFNKSIDELVKNQSFLAAIDKQDDFADTEQDKRQAAAESLAGLREDMAVERAEKQMALKAEQEDRFAAIVEARNLTMKAEREELRLKRVAQNDVLQLQRSKAEQEINLQQQVNKNIVGMLTSVAEFSGKVAGQVESKLSQVGNATGGGALSRNNSEVARILAEVMG